MCPLTVSWRTRSLEIIITSYSQVVGLCPSRVWSLFFNFTCNCWWLRAFLDFLAPASASTSSQEGITSFDHMSNLLTTLSLIRTSRPTWKTWTISSSQNLFGNTCKTACDCRSRIRTCHLWGPPFSSQHPGHILFGPHLHL